MGAPAAKEAEEKGADENTPPEEGTGETEEECSAEFRPLVQLEEVERVSGEEGEATLIDLCAALLSPAHACMAAACVLCVLATNARGDLPCKQCCRWAEG
jgi:hypothetical protein